MAVTPAVAASAFLSTLPLSPNAPRAIAACVATTHAMESPGAYPESPMEQEDVMCVAVVL